MILTHFPSTFYISKCTLLATTDPSSIPLKTKGGGGGTTVSKQRVLTNVRHLSNVRFLLEKRITYGGSRAPKDQPLSYTLFFKFFLPFYGLWLTLLRPSCNRMKLNGEQNMFTTLIDTVGWKQR